MPRTPCRIRCVTEAASLRTGGEWAAQAPNFGRVRPSTGARCGKAARRDLRGGREVTPAPTATCARRSWRDPAGERPVREGGSARPVASVAGSSVTMVLKRTQRDDEDCIELRKILTVEAEALRTAAGNMCGTVMRGTVAPPESETSSSRQGSCRNLGDLMPPAVATAIPGHDRKSDGRRCRGRYEESDGCIVPMKPRTTSADGLMAESVEGRRPVEGRVKANACSGHRAGTGMSPTA